MRLFLTLAGLVIVGIFSWFIGQNITPEIVMAGVALIGGGLLAGIVTGGFWFVMREHNRDRADERAQRDQQQQPQAALPPVVIITPSHQIGQRPQDLVTSQSNGEQYAHTWRGDEQYIEVRR